MVALKVIEYLFCSFGNSWGRRVSFRLGIGESTWSRCSYPTRRLLRIYDLRWVRFSKALCTGVKRISKEYPRSH